MSSPTPRVTVEDELRFGDLTTLTMALDHGLSGKSIRGLVYRPRSYRPDAPVVVVMHGVTRAADQYIASWMPAAERRGFLLIVPEFSRTHFPKARQYNLGNMRKGGRLLPRTDWTFTVVETLVDHVLARVGSTRTRFALYGHSAGAQFVHRYVMFTGGARLTGAVAANSGWYTLPTEAFAFPYGVADAPHLFQTLPGAYATPLTLMLGSDDTDADDPDLRRTAEAMAQGPHRLARGRTFHETCRTDAAARQLPFTWSLHEVPGLGHNDRDTAEIAFDLLLPGASGQRSAA
jgi:poly(3-hydroxybutyrate) depolymerase